MSRLRNSHGYIGYELVRFGSESEEKQKRQWLAQPVIAATIVT
jgi:hypothetical protein